MQVLLVIGLGMGAIAFKRPTCDCTGSKLIGILKTDDYDCEKVYQGSSESEIVEYAVYTTKEQEQTIIGYTCAVWTSTRSVESFFFGGTDTTFTKTTNLLSREECWELINYKSCDGRPMVQAGRKWSSLSEPEGVGEWFRRIKYHAQSCIVQEIDITKDCRNCPLITPFGKMPFDADVGVAFADKITYVWQDIPYDVRACDVSHIGEGDGKIFETPQELRLTDAVNQLDFMLDTNTTILCDSQTYSKVLGIDDIYIRYSRVSNQSEQKPAPFRFWNEKANHNLQAHVQYSRNGAVDNDNVLVSELRVVQCQLKQMMRNDIVTTAHINPVLAAERMGFGDCHQVIARGNMVRLIQCEMRLVEFTAELTHCGYQPRAGEKTISSDGWNLADYHPCYWPEGFVNFNGKTHYYNGSNWEMVEPNLDLSIGRLIHMFNFSIDNTARWMQQHHPGGERDYLSQMAVLADLMAEMNGNTEPITAHHVDKGRSKISEIYDQATSYATYLVGMLAFAGVCAAILYVIGACRKNIKKCMTRACVTDFTEPIPHEFATACQYCRPRPREWSSEPNVAPAAFRLETDV